MQPTLKDKRAHQRHERPPPPTTKTTVSKGQEFFPRDTQGGDTGPPLLLTTKTDNVRRLSKEFLFYSQPTGREDGRVQPLISAN